MLGPAVRVDLPVAPVKNSIVSAVEVVTSESPLIENIDRYWYHCWDSIRYLGLEAFLSQDMNSSYLKDKEFRRHLSQAGDLSDEMLAAPQLYREHLLRSLNVKA